MVALAQGQVGYQTDPSDTYCNKFSAYWYAGTDDCGNDNRDEEWCADFAAWVWKQAGAEVAYQLAPGYLNGNSASFYVWGTDHGTWHPSAPATPPNRVTSPSTGSIPPPSRLHVAIVTSGHGQRRRARRHQRRRRQDGLQRCEVGDNQAFADAKQKGAPLSGYVSSPLPLTSDPEIMRGPGATQYGVGSQTRFRSPACSRPAGRSTSSPGSPPGPRARTRAPRPTPCSRRTAWRSRSAPAR